MDALPRTKINIAIDGPAGAGKSTVARLLAKELGYIYVDTGAMYRVITWKAIQLNIQPHEIKRLEHIAQVTQIELIPHSDGQQVLADSQDVTEAIRSVAVNRLVSQVSQVEQVRSILTLKQQAMAAAKGVVMDGRDIGTQVLPDAELKVFLIAAVRERAMRRHLELKRQGVDISLERIMHDIEQRDHMDEHRDLSPLVQAEDAILVDCTAMTATEVMEHILELCRSVMGGTN